MSTLFVSAAAASLAYLLARLFIACIVTMSTSELACTYGIPITVYPAPHSNPLGFSFYFLILGFHVCCRSFFLCTGICFSLLCNYRVCCVHLSGWGLSQSYFVYMRYVWFALSYTSFARGFCFCSAVVQGFVLCSFIGLWARRELVWACELYSVFSCRIFPSGFCSWASSSEIADGLSLLGVILWFWVVYS